MIRLLIILIGISAMIASFALGYLFGRRRINKSKQEALGTLRIDRSDPDGPYLFLELETDISNVLTKESVVFKVSTKDYLNSDPQE